jgi:hypothetical protein
VRRCAVDRTVPLVGRRYLDCRSSTRCVLDLSRRFSLCCRPHLDEIVLDGIAFEVTVEVDVLSASEDPNTVLSSPRWRQASEAGRVLTFSSWFDVPE